MMSEVSVNDGALMKSLREGDRVAFRHLYDRYWTPLYRVACNRVGEADAKDLIQEIMVSLWQRREHIYTDDSGSLAPYLFSALKYRIIRHYAYEEIEIKNGQFFDVVSPFTAERELEYQELAGLIEQQVSTMPPRMQQIFRMSREDGISIASIATHLSLSEQTVKNQLSEALKRLRAHLQGNNFSDWAIVLTWFFWCEKP